MANGKSDNVAPLPAALPIEEADACFIVRGANGQALAYVYYEQEPAARGGVGAATAASLPRALIMASSLRPCASTTRHQSKPWPF